MGVSIGAPDLWKPPSRSSLPWKTRYPPLNYGGSCMTLSTLYLGIYIVLWHTKVTQDPEKRLSFHNKAFPLVYAGRKIMRLGSSLCPLSSLTHGNPKVLYYYISQKMEPYNALNLPEPKICTKKLTETRNPKP